MEDMQHNNTTENEQDQPQESAEQYRTPQFDAQQYRQPQNSAPQAQQSPYSGQQYQQPQYSGQQYQQPPYGAPQYQQPPYGGQQYQPPQYSGQQYQQPPYGAPQYQPPKPKEPTNGLAVTSMVLGIISIVFCMLFYFSIPCGIAGLIFGIVAKKNPAGRGVRIAGVWTSVIGLFLGVLILVVILLSVGYYIDKGSYSFNIPFDLSNMCM